MTAVHSRANLRRAAPRCCRGNRRAFAADMNCAGLRAHAAAAAVWAHCVRRSSCCISVACGMLHVVSYTHTNTQTHRHTYTYTYISICPPVAVPVGRRLVYCRRPGYATLQTGDARRRHACNSASASHLARRGASAGRPLKCAHCAGAHRIGVHAGPTVRAGPAAAGRAIHPIGGSCA